MTRSGTQISNAILPKSASNCHAFQDAGSLVVVVKTTNAMIETTAKAVRSAQHIAHLHRWIYAQ